MTKPPPATNFDRLARHLKQGTLAARLVNVRITVGAAGQQAALGKLIADRLNELRQAHAGTANQ